MMCSNCDSHAEEATSQTDLSDSMQLIEMFSLGMTTSDRKANLLKISKYDDKGTVQSGSVWSMV